MLTNLPLFVALALVAEILGTVGGFGSSLFFVPIASYFLDFHSVLGITALFHVSSNLAKIALFRNGFDKKLLLSIGIPSVLFVIAGAFLSKFVRADLLEIYLALFLIVVSTAFLVLKNLSVKPTLTNSVGGGIISGFVAGLLGTGGAIRGVTLAAYHLKMEIFIATSAAIDLAVDASRTIIYWSNGYMRKEHFYLVPILLLVSIAGTYIGKRILSRISEQQFRVIVLFLVLATGIVTLLKVTWN